MVLRVSEQESCFAVRLAKKFTSTASKVRLPSLAQTQTTVDSFYGPLHTRDLYMLYWPRYHM